MKLAIGIVGLPNVGKSTLFNLLTKQQVNAANYPFATIDPNVGVVAVPDERLIKLWAMNKSKKIIPAVVEFYDIAGLVKGAHQGEGLGNQFLSHIRDVQAIVHMVRCFKDDTIVHVDQSVDPLRDIDTITMELIFKDLETVKKRREKLEGEARTGDKAKMKAFEAVKRAEEELGRGVLVRNMGEASDDPAVKELHLLTAKPQLFLLNGNANNADGFLKETISKLRSAYIAINLINAGDISSLMKKAYELLGLISFFTTGEDETRAWTIERGTKAPQAAGVIHSDFEKKFIRAEVINWAKLLEVHSTSSGQTGSAWSTARQKGWLRVEGKEYVVEDGDVMEIRHAP